MQTPKLSPRENQVIRRMLRGDKQSAIASELKISCRTVETYVARAKAKFEAHSLIQLVVRVVESRSNGRPQQRKSVA